MKRDEKQLNVKNKMVGIYLSGGLSKRMGRPKLDLQLGDSYLGTWGLQAALQSDLERIVVVINPDHVNVWLRPLENHPKIEVVPCSNSYEGQAESLKAGVKHIDSSCEAFMILLADQPFVSVDHLNLLIRKFHEYKNQNAACTFAASIHEAVPRPPIIFDIAAAEDIQTLHGDRGAKSLLQQYEQHGIWLENKDLWNFLDVDTVEDYKLAAEYIRTPKLQKGGE